MDALLLVLTGIVSMFEEFAVKMDLLWAEGATMIVGVVGVVVLVSWWCSCALLILPMAWKVSSSSSESPLVAMRAKGAHV